MLHPEWLPDAELTGALAVRFEVPVTRIGAEVPNFVNYWTKGKGAGTRRALWGETFRRWIAKAAKDGDLYAGPRAGAVAIRNGSKAGDVADILMQRAIRLRAEGR